MGKSTSNRGTLPSGVLENKKSYVYHYAECKNYNAMFTQKNVVRIDTVEDALEAGYYPANDCPDNTATQLTVMTILRLGGIILHAKSVHSCRRLYGAGPVTVTLLKWFCGIITR